MVTEDNVDLLHKIFVAQEKRISMVQLLSHPFLGVVDDTGNIIGIDNGNIETKTDDEVITIANPLVVSICVGIYSKLDDLIGTIADYKNIINTFKNGCTMDVLCCNDHANYKYRWTKHEIFTFIKQINERYFNVKNSSNNYDSMIFFISAHGIHDKRLGDCILDTNCKLISIESIMRQFKQANPKMFFVDSCNYGDKVSDAQHGNIDVFADGSSFWALRK